MHQLIEDITEASRGRGVAESDRATARLALLVVLDHLDRALSADELEELGAAMPAGLAVMLQRRRGYDRPPLDLVEPALVAIVCEVLATLPIDPALHARLRAAVPRQLLERGAEVRRGPPRPPFDHDEHPTLRVVSQLRPTIRIAPEDVRRTA